MSYSQHGLCYSASTLESSVMADDTITEEREELMVSSSSGEVHLTKAHFLKPPTTSVDGTVAAPSLNRSSSSSAATSCKDLPFTVSYGVWGLPSPNWQKWVNRMRSSRHSTWERAGILNAITISTYSIYRRETLILGLVEKWSSTTNSFVFSWGEATITLEDMMALGAYSVLGESVLTPLEDVEMEEKVAELLGARLELYSSPAKKACLNGWMAKFMDSAAEIEHEAFLAYWLSKFVFPIYSNAIGKSVLPIAVHLARGTRIALAPAVLASIYRNLRLLKDAVSKPTRKRVVVLAPLLLVQVWAWERFPALRPNPRRVKENEPRIARWSGFVKGGGGASAALDFGGEDGFRWQPYASGGVCMDDERWETVVPGLNRELESFVRCVRVSKLVGLEKEKECVEQYLPHRVAMQFGMDQDLPFHVAQDKPVDPEIAWKDYIRPVGEAKIYVPSRLSLPCVTSRYLQWWKELNGATDDKDSQSLAAPKMTGKKRKRVVEVLIGEAATVSEQGRRHCTTANNAKSAFGGKGCYKRTKRSYLKSFRRQRSADFEPLRWHSAASAKSSETKSPETLEHDDSDYLCSAPKSNPMRASDLGSNKVTEPSGCEIDGNDQDREENCLLSAVGNAKVVQVMPSVETEAKLMQGKEVSEAMIDRGEEKIGTYLSRDLSLGGLEERVRILEDICKMLEAGKLACFPKGSS